MRSTCLCFTFAQVLHTVSLFFRGTFIQGTPLPACRCLLFPLFPRATKEIGDVCTQARDTSIQRKQIFAQKNVKIIFVYVTSNSGI